MPNDSQLQAAAREHHMADQKPGHNRGAATPEGVVTVSQRTQSADAPAPPVALLASTVRRHAVAAMNVATRAEFNAADFLAIASHDLLAPLASMTIAAAGIEERSATGAGDIYMRRWAQHILEQARRMERLIRDLDFDTLEEGRLRLTTAPHDLALLVNQATDAFRPMAAEKSIVLSRDVAGPLVVRCEPSRILQVLSNLIDNAVKFTPAGGSVRVRATKQHADCHVAIVDTGVGIARTRLKSVFGSVSPRTFDGHGGRPLGLYISRAIVDAHGGRIWAEGEPGGGTTIVLTLPRT
jgi:signal transduction histidine kinase